MNIFGSFPDQLSLDQAYSPSRFVPDLPAYIREYESRSARVREALGNGQTLAYGPSRAERLDLFVAPDTQGPCDTVVYFHGGYWQELSKDHHSFPAQALNAAGLNFAAVGYGLAPDLRLSDIVGQCRAALKWLAAHSRTLSIASGLHLVGHSAGGQLAAMAVLADRRFAGAQVLPVKSVTTLSGVFDLRPIALTYVNDVLRMSDEEALACSPALCVDLAQGQLPRHWLVYAEREPAEFARQSAQFADGLRASGAEVALSCIRDRNHFDLILDLADPASPLFQSLLRHIAGRGG